MEKEYQEFNDSFVGRQTPSSPIQISEFTSFTHKTSLNSDLNPITPANTTKKTKFKNFNSNIINNELNQTKRRTNKAIKKSNY